jgi:PadR family transcriptional regulator, regulatory protein PadR
MTDDVVVRHLFLGFIRLHILYHADKDPICGAELMEELGEHGYDVGPGTIYPVLHQMQAAKLITSKAEVIGGKRRNNFRTTAAGRKLLGEARTKLRELASEVLEDKDARKRRGSRT